MLPHPCECIVQEQTQRAPMSQTERHKPGADFAFKPTNNIASPELPDFSKSPRKHNNTAAAALSEISSTMVNERAPPKAPSLASRLGGGGSSSAANDDDDDISAIIGGWAALKSNVRENTAADMFLSATSRPQFGHPTKMMSSRKQKADVFIHQKSRPEHHIGNTKINAPKAPAYRDRRPPPMPVFDSNNASSSKPRDPPVKFGEEVFYTDPNKANADLKDLLEGGMDEEEEEEEEEEETKESQQPPAADSPQEKISTPSSTVSEPKAKRVPRKRMNKNGSVEGLQVKLLPHQVEGVEWMRGRELGPVKKGIVPKGGLLADDMGLGKTLQTLSLILTNQKPAKDAPEWKDSFDKVEKTTLVIAPLALIRQWEHEINDKVEKKPGLKVLVHHGPQRTKKFDDLKKYDVVITTYQILVSDHGHSSDAPDGPKNGCFGLHWWRIVLDEAHTIKNRNAKTTKACYALRSEYRWCLSGTPMQNNLDELQSLVKFLRIKPYDDLRQWRDHIDQPLKNGKGHIAIRRLHSVLLCFMKRRTKDILKQEGALNPGGKPTVEGEEESAGPGFKHTERKVVTVAAELSAAERQFYDRLEDRTDKSMKAMMQEKMSYLNAFTLLLRLRQACNHPKLVEGKIEKDRDAMTTDNSQSQKSQDTDMDAMADLFSGMGIASKKCSVCALDLPKEDAEKKQDTCSDCLADMASFKEFEKSGKTAKKAKKSKKHGKSKATKTERAAAEPSRPARRQRNRNAIIDSDDEDDEGSWLVGEEERGNLKLGKAGGEEDENAAGPTEWLGSDDSAISEDAEDQSNLSSFVVDDEAAKKDPADDSLLSIYALSKQMASQTLDERPEIPSQASATEDNEDSGSGSDTSASDSGVDESELYSSDDEQRPQPGSTQVMASAKIRELTRILHSEVADHKFIVFSQFTSMLDLIEPFMRKEGFKFTRYDGSMRNDEREESLRRLREDKGCRVLLCSLKCGSLGLNLTAATRVIIVEPFWNPVSTYYAGPALHTPC